MTATGHSFGLSLGIKELTNPQFARSARIKDAGLWTKAATGENERWFRALERPDARLSSLAG
jgi:hypothetical protein